jgi:uncharacterized protein with HEPN domain
MSYNNLELIRHLLDEVAFILQHTKGRTKEETVQDAVLSRAIVRSLEIIGEAARKTDQDFKTNHREVEWKKMSGTRDKLIHDYFGIDYDIVWEIIQERLPLLKVQLEKIMKAS